MLFLSSIITISMFFEVCIYLRGFHLQNIRLQNQTSNQYIDVHRIESWECQEYLLTSLCKVKYFSLLNLYVPRILDFNKNAYLKGQQRGRFEGATEGGV